MLLVIALLGLLASTVFVMLPRGGGDADVILAAEQLRTELATMRSRARSGEGRAAFGVLIATSTYTGIRVDGMGTTTLGTELLPGGVSVTPGVVLFQAISGRAVPTSIVISSTQASTSITVAANGAIQ